MRGFECVQEELRECVEWVCVGGGPSEVSCERGLGGPWI